VDEKLGKGQIGIGSGRVAGKEVERELSTCMVALFFRTSLYIGSIAHTGSIVFVQNAKIAAGEGERPPKQRRGWGGSFISSAYSAGVFGAALGL
jgi:hypothetical protein